MIRSVREFKAKKHTMPVPLSIISTAPLRGNKEKYAPVGLSLQQRGGRLDTTRYWQHKPKLKHSKFARINPDDVPRNEFAPIFRQRERPGPAIQNRDRDDVAPAIVAVEGQEMDVALQANPPDVINEGGSRRGRNDPLHGNFKRNKMVVLPRGKKNPHEAEIQIGKKALKKVVTVTNPSDERERSVRFKTTMRHIEENYTKDTVIWAQQFKDLHGILPSKAQLKAREEIKSFGRR